MVDHVVRLTGDVDAERLLAALQEVIAANLHLRVQLDLDAPLTTCQRITEDPMDRVRVVRAPAPASARQLLEAEVDALCAARDEIAADDRCPFTARIICVGDASTIVYWRASIGVLDGLSADQLVAETLNAYDRGTHAPPVDPARDAAQIDALVGADLAGFAAHEDYWAKKLADAPVSTQLPDPDPRWSVGALVGSSRHAGALSLEASSHVEALANELRCTTHAVLLAGLASLLHLSTGAECQLLNVNVPARTPSEMRRIGRYGQLAMLRVDTAAGSSFEDVVLAVKEDLNETLAHRRFPNSRMIELLAAEGGRVGTIPTVVITYDGWSDRRTAAQRAAGGRITAAPAPDLEARMARRIEARTPLAPLSDDDGKPYPTLTDYGFGTYYLTGFKLLTIPSEGRIDYVLDGPMTSSSLELVAGAWARLVRDGSVHPRVDLRTLWTSDAQRRLSDRCAELRPPDAVRHRGLTVSRVEDHRRRGAPRSRSTPESCHTTGSWRWCCAPTPSRPRWGRSAVTCRACSQGIRCRARARRGGRHHARAVGGGRRTTGPGTRRQRPRGGPTGARAPLRGPARR